MRKNCFCFFGSIFEWSVYVVDDLLREERACDVILPRIQKRHVLEESNELEARVSILEADDLDMDEDEEEEEADEEFEEKRRMAEMIDKAKAREREGNIRKTNKQTIRVLKAVCILQPCPCPTFL